MVTLRENNGEDTAVFQRFRVASASILPSRFSLDIVSMSFTGERFIPIRKNITTTVVSNWRADADGTIHAAFVFGEGVSGQFDINALFRFATENGNNVPVRVRTNTLGDSGEVTVSRSGALPGTNVATFTLGDALNTARQHGFAGRNITFMWQYKDESGRWRDMRSIAIRAKIYFIPSVPRLPWVTNEAGNRNPWTDAFDLILGWGVNGMSDIMNISSQITKYFNESSFISYELVEGAPSFLSENEINFNCTGFIKRYRSRQPTTVNCVDCSMIVSTFSNLLGDTLIQVQFGDVRFGFNCNRIKIIGFDLWQFPFPQIEENGVLRTVAFDDLYQSQISCSHNHLRKIML